MNKSKKIGILTFQNVDNYGALLQAYALKTVICQQGNSVQIINYHSPVLESPYHFFNKPKCFSFMWLFKKLLKLPLLPMFFYTRSRFASFRKEYLTDMPLTDSKNLVTNTKNFDILITGSDQVFNPRITGMDDNFFLTFAKEPRKCVSYAASFGRHLNQLNEQEKKYIQKNIPSLGHISVREAQGAEIVHTLCPNYHAQVHIDPTLLLTPSDWAKIFKIPKTKNYVLLYLMYRDPALIKFAVDLAQKKRCQLVFISQTVYVRNRIAAKHIIPTLQEWVGLFAHAQYIVTTSFHGLAFSINFNKPFTVAKATAKGANSRIESLLSLTGLQNRLFSSPHHVPTEPINWEFVNQQLDKERQKAFAYLREITK